MAKRKVDELDNTEIIEKTRSKGIESSNNVALREETCKQISRYFYINVVPLKVAESEDDKLKGQVGEDVNNDNADVDNLRIPDDDDDDEDVDDEDGARNATDDIVDGDGSYMEDKVCELERCSRNGVWDNGNGKERNELVLERNRTASE
ncbi:hypothetical protein JHK85_039971 [Glycine max]|nr:hypothetical protein JHK85_039971 [Glycine max]